jgi:hypothetical protein
VPNIRRYKDIKKERKIMTTKKKITLKEGDVLSQTEFLKELHIGKQTFKKDPEYVLNHISIYYDFTVRTMGKRTYYTIKQVLGEYKPLPRSRKAVEERNQKYQDAIYENAVEKIDKETNRVYLTYKDAADAIEDKQEIKKLKYAKSTNYEYTRHNMKIVLGNTRDNINGKHGRFVGRVWCKQDEKTGEYIRMPQDHIDMFYKILSQPKVELLEEQEVEMWANAVSQRRNKEISVEEYNEIISFVSYCFYTGAVEEFKKKYGYAPYKVPAYEVLAFNDEYAAEAVENK